MAGNGPFSGGLGGGSNSAVNAAATSVNYPVYLQNIHSDWLTGTTWDTGDPSYTATFGSRLNVSESIEALRSSAGGTPFSGVTSFDPSDDLDNIEDKLSTYSDKVTEFDPDTVISDAIQTANDYVTDYLLPDTEIDDAVNAFERRSLGAYQRQVSRVMHGFQDIGAVMCSQVGMALANMEQDRADQLNDLDSRHRLFAQRQRNENIMAITNSIVQLKLSEIDANKQALGVQMDVSKFNIVAQQDKIEKDIEYELRNDLWDLELLTYGTSVMNSITGAAMVPRAQTKGERFVAALTTSGAFGLEVGGALKNPAAGVAAGGVLLAAQLLTGLQ